MAVVIRDQLFNQRVTLIKAIHSSGKLCVALSRAGICIRLVHGNVEFLQHIGNDRAGLFLPEHIDGLIIRDDIPNSGIYLFQSISCIPRDQDVFKRRNTGIVGSGIQIYGLTGCACAVQMEFYTGVELIFRVLCHGYRTLLQNIGEGNRGGLSGSDRDGLCILRLVIVGNVFRDRISSGDKTLQADSTVGIGFYSLIEVLSGDCHADTGNITVLAGLHDIQIAARSCDLEAGLHVIRLLNAGNYILKAGIAPCDKLRVGADVGALHKADGHSAIEVILAGQRQRIARLCDLHIAVRRCDRAGGQNAVGICQLQYVLTIFIGHIPAGAIRKARHHMVGGHSRYDVVIDSQHFLIVTTGAKGIDDTVIYTLESLRITDTTGHFPYQNLSGCALRASGTSDASAVTRPAEGQNSLHSILLIFTQGIPSSRSVGTQSIARHEPMTGFNAVRFLTVHIDHATVRSARAVSCGIPGSGEGSPIADICAITLIAVIKRRHTRLRGSGKCCCRHKTEHHQDAKYSRKNPFRFFFENHALPSFIFFYCVFGMKKEECRS